MEFKYNIGDTCWVFDQTEYNLVPVVIEGRSAQCDQCGATYKVNRLSREKFEDGSEGKFLSTMFLVEGRLFRTPGDFIDMIRVKKFESDLAELAEAYGYNFT